MRNVPALKLLLAYSLSKGFSLIELMVVIAVIAILATIALFGLRSAQGWARNTQRQQVMNSVRASLERFYGDKNVYPATTNFSDMYATLSTGNYITGVPVDPGCGSGPATYPKDSLAVLALTNGNWAPCTAGTGAVTYSYNGVTGGYTLNLIKEAGGSNTFSNPR